MTTRFNQLPDQYFDGAGNPLVDGKIKFEIPGGGTDLDTFADQDLTILNSNPVILSATGVPPNIFFNGEAKAFLLDKDDVQIRVLDPVPGTGSALDAFSDYSASITYSIEDITRGSTDRYFKSITNANLGNDPVTTTGFWIEINFIHTWDTAYTFSIDFIAVASDSNLYVSRVNLNVGNDPVSSPTEWRLLTETGSVVGPGSSTDNAVARYDLATGLLIQDSGVLIDDSDNVSGIGTLASGTHTIASGDFVLSSGNLTLTDGKVTITNTAAEETLLITNNTFTANILRVISTSITTGSAIRGVQQTSVYAAVGTGLVSGDVQGASSTGPAGYFKTAGSGPPLVTEGAAVSTNFTPGLKIGGRTIFDSDGTTANGNLSGVVGDWCMNGGSGTGQAAYCTGGTNWTDFDL